MTTKPVIAFLGIGLMGNHMARNLLAAGFVVRAWNRTKDKALALEKDGAIRLADRPEYQLCCDMDKQEPDAKITIYEYMDTEVHRFVRNEDDTISPKKSLDLILVLKEDLLRLEEKEKA